MTMARPDILVICFDSLSETDLGRYLARLPNFNRLRQTGVTFTNAFACSPESGPSCASFFTGLDMAAHGVWTDGVALPGHEVTFPERLTTAGYHTWLVGRRHLAGVSNWTTEHARPGEYHHFDWAHGPLHRSRQNAYLTWLQEKAPDVHSRIFPSQANPDDGEIPAWQRAAMAEIADDLSFNGWVGAQVCTRLSEIDDDQPFLGIAGFVVGDTMGAATEGLCIEVADKRSLEQADAALKVMYQNLMASGRAENTVIVLTAARGSAPDAMMTHAMQDDATHVPLTLCVPGGAAGDIEAIVSTMDIAPTLYDLAQAVPPQRIQGVSHLSEDPRGWALIRLRNPNATHQTALRTDRFKLIATHGADVGYQLFDMIADPGETTDLASNQAHQQDLEDMIDFMIDARVALEDRTEPRVAMF